MTSILVEQVLEKYGGGIVHLTLIPIFFRILVCYANKIMHFGKYTLYRNLISNINMCICKFVYEYRFLKCDKKFLHFLEQRRKKKFFNLKLSGYSSEMRYNFIYKLFSSSNCSLSVVLSNDSWYNLKHGSA